MVTIQYREFWKIHETLLAGLVGALGAIIGGLFTLWGVNVTIKNQNKTDYINSYPSRILIADSILNSFSNRLDELNQAIKNKSFGLLTSSHFLKEYKNILNSSAGVSVEFYRTVKGFLDIIKNIDEISSGAFRPSNNVKGAEYHEHYLKEYKELMNKLKRQFEIIISLIVSMEMEYSAHIGKLK